MKTTKLNTKTILAGMVLGFATLTAPQMASAQVTPNPSLELPDGPSGKLDLGVLQDIKSYAINANSDITRLLNAVAQMNDSVEIKNKLFNGINNIISNTKGSRSTLLLTQSLQAGITLVKLIDQQSIQRGLQFTPQGTVDQEVRIMRQSLNFAKEYYESDFAFINGVLAKNEVKTNPKFVEFGMKLNSFIIKMSDGVLNARASYGMIRWSLALLANYIKNDKEIGIAYASTRYNIATTLTEKDLATGKSIYPDLVNGEMAPSDVECVIKIRNLKLLAMQSMDEMKKAKAELDKATVEAKTEAKAEIEAAKNENITNTTPLSFQKKTTWKLMDNNKNIYGYVILYQKNGQSLADLFKWDHGNVNFPGNSVTETEVGSATFYTIHVGNAQVLMEPTADPKKLKYTYCAPGKQCMSDSKSTGTTTIFEKVD